MTEIVQTLGHQCAELLKEARKAGPVQWDEVARIIDHVVAGRSDSQIATSKKSSGRGKGLPTPEEVTAYSAEIGYPMDGAKWCDFYAAKGWKVGHAIIKDWKAAVRNWKNNCWGVGSVVIGAGPRPQVKALLR